MAQDRPAIDPKAHTAADRPIVAFDFDGTLTVRDSFTGFLKWRVGPVRYALGLLRLAPNALAYLVHRDRGRIKAAAAREFLRGGPPGPLQGRAPEVARGSAAHLLPAP